jgi:hypothetical protein
VVLLRLKKNLKKARRQVLEEEDGQIRVLNKLL